jgi:hypothetical protein
MNERDFPHLVELELPSGGFRNTSLEPSTVKKQEPRGKDALTRY